MSVLKVRKVTALPGSYEPSTLYIVTDSDVSYAKMYISDKVGVSVRRLPSRDDINSWISVALGGYNNATVVANIAARDALESTLVANAQVMVLDASGDTTVASGAATYVYDFATTTWTKISEAESMDVVLNWTNIIGRPASSVNDIDDAVTKRHSHANMNVLNGLSDNAGRLEYNGGPIRAYLDEEAW